MRLNNIIAIKLEFRIINVELYCLLYYIYNRLFSIIKMTIIKKNGLKSNLIRPN